MQEALSILKLYIERNKNLFKLHFYRLFCIRFKMFAFLTTHGSHVCRESFSQIVDIICTFMNGGSFEVDTFASDVFMSKLGSLLSVTCHHCSVHTVHMESRFNVRLFDKRQFDSNLLPFTPFLTV